MAHGTQSLCTIVGDCIEVHTAALTATSFETFIRYRNPASSAWARDVVLRVMLNDSLCTTWADAQQGHRRIVETLRAEAARQTRSQRTRSQEE